MTTNTSAQQDESTIVGNLSGDFLFGAEAIGEFLINTLGMPETTDPYYLKRVGWPIGNTGGNKGPLVATRRRLASHLEKRARGKSAT